MAISDDFGDMRFSPSGAPLRPRRPELADFAEVLEAARAGDSWAFDRLFRDIQRPLRAFAQARGAQDPDGLTNEVLAEVFGALPAFTGDESAYRGFVFHVARRRLIDEYRRHGRRPTLELRSDPPEPMRSATGPGDDPAVAAVDADAAVRALQCLTPDQRDVILLRVVADLSLVETAAALDKPVTAVKALQRRALGTLRRSFSAGVVSS